MTDYHWREEWQKVFCIKERRYAVDMNGWFSVVAIHKVKDKYRRYAVHFGRKETAVEVYSALQDLVDVGVLDGCYVYADACSVEDHAPCLMDRPQIRIGLEDD